MDKAIKNRKVTIAAVGGLIILSAVFYLTNLGRLPLEDYDEATYAQVLKESVQRGNYLSFTYFGENWFEKPPLQFWLAAASTKVFGFNEFGLRLPSAAFGILSVVLVYLTVKEVSGNALTGFLSGLFLILMPFFLAAARNFRMDIPVTASILAALYFFILGSRNGKYLLGAGATLGIGILLKSVIALLAAPIVLIFAAVFKNWGWIRNRYLYYSTLLFFAVSAPWHIYQTYKFGLAFWRDYFGYHILQRATQNILGSKITVGYFISSLWDVSEPLVPTFAAAVILTAIFLYRGSVPIRLAAASIVSATFIFVVFSSVQTKLVTYYTPIYPFLAISIGNVLVLAIESARTKWAKAAWGLLVTVVIANAGFSTLSETFTHPQIYASKATADEKHIGLYLAGNSKESEEINIFNWNHHNTIRYYSGRITESLQFGTGRQPQAPFWLVLPTEVLEINPALKKFPTPFSGKYLSLIRVAE